MLSEQFSPQTSLNSQESILYSALYCIVLCWVFLEQFSPQAGLDYQESILYSALFCIVLCWVVLCCVKGAGSTSGTFMTSVRTFSSSDTFISAIVYYSNFNSIVKGWRREHTRWENLHSFSRAISCLMSSWERSLAYSKIVFMVLDDGVKKSTTAASFSLKDFVIC